MKDFFRKIKIIDSFTTELPITQQEFVKKLSAVVDKGETGLFSNPFDMFSSSKNEFKGKIYFDKFEIKRRRRFFDTALNIAVANGKLTEDKNTLIITTEINGFTGFIIPYYIFLIVFYSLFLINFVFTINNALVNIFLMVHALMMFGIPFFIMKNSVKRLKYDLEREYYYLTKNIVTTNTI